MNKWINQMLAPENFVFVGCGTLPTHDALSEITKFILHNLNMTDSFKERPIIERKPKLHTILSLMDLRAGHWPGTKTPPWLLNETWEMNNPQWREYVTKQEWQQKQDKGELLVGSGVIKMDQEVHEVDIYAKRDERRGSEYFCFAAYPREKSRADFWDEEGDEINPEGEE